ncbi:MAG: porin [Geobacteraceae bacterium]|nr:porin [Geobacteraceae bacterium]
MKKKIALLSLGVIVAQSGVACATTLEDVLKQKGVITEEEYKEIVKAGKTTQDTSLSHALGKGYTMTSPDGKFQISVGGRLQARYSFTDLQDNSKTSDSSKWEVKRMKFWLTGHAYTKDLTYLLQTDFTQGGSSKLLEHAYLNYRPLKELQLLAGQTKVPFGRQWLNSSGGQQFVDRSTASDMFRPGYDIGVKLHGDLFNSLVTYEIGGYGGAGQSITRSSDENAMAARLTLNPFGAMPYSEGDLDQSKTPKLSFGADYYMNSLAATYNATTKADSLETNNITLAGSTGWLGKGLGTFKTSENIDVKTFGLDTAFKWQGASLQAEYLEGQADGRSSGKVLRAQGWYVQAGYFILPKTVELAMRYSSVDPNRELGGDLQSDTQGAVSWYINKHNLKLQADVTGTHTQHGTNPSTDDMMYRLQAQVIF